MNKLQIEDIIIIKGKSIGAVHVPNEDIVNIESTVNAHYAKLKSGDLVKLSDGRHIKVASVSLFSPGVLDIGTQGIAIVFEGDEEICKGEITWDNPPPL